MEDLVKLLKQKGKTISCMESCTGGMLANEITNIDGSSYVFKLGLVTYSNEYKEYFGVPKDVIDEYTVYSTEVSKEMAYNVFKITNSDYAVGITGMLGAVDPCNKCEDINKIYISIYVKDNNKYFNYELEALEKSRIEKKNFVINFVKEKLYGICK